jgi:hypothetical protein
MKSCQATFCTPLNICQNWARFTRKIKLYKFIESTLKIAMAEISILLKKGLVFAYVECPKNFNDTVRFLVEHYPNVGFTKFKVQRIVNLFEDTGSVRELSYFAKISRSCFSPLWKN